MNNLDDKVFCEHPDPAKVGTDIDEPKYRAMRKALLRHIPKRKGGVPFKGMREAVKPLLPGAVFRGASISWYVTTVKLDLEAKGLIERVPGVTPQHMRRV